MMIHQLRRALALGSLMLPLAACSQESELPPVASAQISGYNHTPQHIGQYYIDGQRGGNIHAYEGGGSFVCCITYPRQWRNGLNATVKWTTSSSNPADPRVQTWHEKIVPIERYENTGTTLNVHFLPNSEVRLIVTDMSAKHPDYTGPAAPAPPSGWPPWRRSEQTPTSPANVDTVRPPRIP